MQHVADRFVIDKYEGSNVSFDATPLDPINYWSVLDTVTEERMWCESATMASVIAWSLNHVVKGGKLAVQVREACEECGAPSHVQWYQGPTDL